MTKSKTISTLLRGRTSGQTSDIVRRFLSQGKFKNLQK